MSENDPNPPKRGKRSWLGANNLHVSKIPDNHVTRWIRKDDPANVERHLELGWKIADARQEQRGDGITAGKPLTSADEYRELVRVVLHEDDKAERDAEVAAVTQRQWEGIKQDAEDRMRSATGGKARVRGTITIS